MVPEQEQEDLDDLGWDKMDTGSEDEKKPESEPEGEAGLKEDEEGLSDEELKAAFGGKWQRLVIPAAISGLTLILILIVWFLGGKLKSTAPEEVIDSARIDSAGMIAAVRDVQPADALVQFIGPEPPGEKEAVTDLGAAIDSTEMDQMLDLPPEDEFLMLLNAAVSDEETEALNDTAFYNLLFTPLIPVEEPPGRGRRIYPRGREPVPEGEEAWLADTSVYFAKIDSLNQVLAETMELLSKSEGSNEMLREEIDRLAGVTDTLRMLEVRKLAKIVESMKPASAANMLKDKRNSDITEVLFKLKPRTAAKVLENLPQPKRSQIVSSIMKKRG